ncbi:hypothetical protein EK21DRAFT_92962 [Setomelanomma holmii]|uniref:Uncharacterized protein n=1 Tax=Setomelanomma holmii TaxID=210430 RepID=A0A9P4H2E4_9PLEO|nr:hypothetical protein EK21DRAFT_92962 [Setomelanomma holmii]
MLLTLPRELRDHIIDQVLLSESPAPAPIERVHLGNGKYHVQPGKRIGLPSHVDTQRKSSLLYANKPLHYEVQERAARLNVALILDLLVLEDGGVYSTWLNSPCGRNWQRIHFMVQVRMQPVHLTRFQERHASFYSSATSVRQVVMGAIAQVVRAAVLWILFRWTPEDAKGLANLDLFAREQKERPTSSIAQLGIDVGGIQGKVETSDRTCPWYNFTAHLEQHSRAILSHVGEMEVRHKGQVVQRWDAEAMNGMAMRLSSVDRDIVLSRRLMLEW